MSLVGQVTKRNMDRQSLGCQAWGDTRILRTSATGASLAPYTPAEPVFRRHRHQAYLAHERLNSGSTSHEIPRNESWFAGLGFLIDFASCRCSRPGGRAETQPDPGDWLAQLIPCRAGSGDQRHARGTQSSTSAGLWTTPIRHWPSNSRSRESGRLSSTSTPTPRVVSSPRRRPGRWCVALGKDPGEDPDASGALQQPGLKILHVPDIDFRTTAPTFVNALKQIRAWSQANRRHVPILILVELKGDALPGLPARPVPFGKEEVDSVDAEILSVFQKAEILTPDRVRGTFASLPEAIKSQGLAQARTMYVGSSCSRSTTKARYETAISTVIPRSAIA